MPGMPNHAPAVSRSIIGPENSSRARPQRAFTVGYIQVIIMLMSRGILIENE